jgi:hypothetical protein
LLVISESWFPANKSAELGKIYLEVMKKYPDNRSISKVIARSINVEKEGIHTIVMSAVKPGKVKEAMDVTTNRLLMLSSIEGYRFRTYVAYELAEAMPLVGLQAPTE